MSHHQPLPGRCRPERADRVYRVPYGEVAAEARGWARKRGIPPAHEDRRKIALLLIDVQNTFCIPGFELFVGGRSGRGAVEDNQRLCRFLYENLHRLTHIVLTMDTHRAAQIFHPLFLVGERGEHPAPFTTIGAEDLQSGRWRFNGDLAPSLGLTPEQGQRHLVEYVEALAAAGRYELTVWPYHAMLGGISHALVSVIEEAVFFHSVARHAPSEIILKGFAPLTEHYSALAPEVLETGAAGRLAESGARLVELVASHEAVIVAGQAKSHCVAWSVRDMIAELERRDPALVGKLYLLDDASSPVVAPGVFDFTDQAEQAYKEFAAAGAHRVLTSEPLVSWPGLAPPLG